MVRCIEFCEKVGQFPKERNPWKDTEPEDTSSDSWQWHWAAVPSWPSHRVLFPSTLIPDQLQINQMSINRGVGGGALGLSEPVVSTYGSLATAAVNTVPRAAHTGHFLRL